MEYGLIGSKLGHSYSKIIHEMLCGYHYDLCPLPTEEEARAFLTRRQFKAINVTIPYKRLVMEYCTYIDPRAKAIGAVNTVVNKNGLLYGYNTDYLGFAHLCDAHGVDFAGKTVLILGTGGTHNTTSAVARDKGAARVLTVSRTPDAAKGQLSYEEAVFSGAQIVINTTPAGMYPNVGVCSLDVAKCPGWKLYWTWCTTPIRRNSSSGPKRPGSRWLWAASRCWWRRPCTPPNTSSAESSTTQQGRSAASLPHSAAICSTWPSSECPPAENLPWAVHWPKSWAKVHRPRRGDRQGRRPQHPRHLRRRGRGRLPREGIRPDRPLCQRGTTAALLRRRHHQAGRESAGAASERRRALPRPAPGCADGGRRTSALVQHRGAEKMEAERRPCISRRQTPLSRTAARWKTP